MLIRQIAVLILVFTFCTYAGAEVTVEDAKALSGRPHMLTAKTKGRFFPKGGVLVEFYVNDDSIGKNLSGGDGTAFKEFTPPLRGLHRITVVSGRDRGSGLLLVLDKGESIVFIDVEGSLPEGGVFPMKPGRGAQDFIKSVSERYPLIYLSTKLGAGILKVWLKKHNFEEAPTLEWGGGDIFDEVMEDGFKIRAIIGSPTVIETAVEHTTNLFSFDEVERAEEIHGWEELDKKIP